MTIGRLARAGLGHCCCPRAHIAVRGTLSTRLCFPQVAAALRKIAGHIGHPKKFSKASQLLRELLAQVGTCGAAAQQRAPLVLYYCAKCVQAAPTQHASCHVLRSMGTPLPPRFTARPLPPRITTHILPPRLCLSAGRGAARARTAALLRPQGCDARPSTGEQRVCAEEGLHTGPAALIALCSCSPVGGTITTRKPRCHSLL